jgi:F420-dependent oxidoreductase-like protein
MAAMRLGLSLGYWASSKQDHVPTAREAERLGYDSLWMAEAYGGDVITGLTWLAAKTERIKVGSAIMQIPARTPAMTAMTAVGLDMITGGRFLLGLGVSGPQVAEGWHGVPYGKPLGRTREYVEIVRTILAREKPLEHHGEHYDIPYTGPGATGLGKPLKLIVHPERPSVPIYLAAIGPKNVELAGEIADGLLPIFYSPSRFLDVYGPALEAGFARHTATTGSAKGFQSAESFDLAASCTVVLGDDVQRCRDAVKPALALYVGGMGAKGRNFYNDLACRYGFEAAAATIQDLYLGGHKAEAVAAVPDELVDQVALCGPAERIADRLEEWKASPVGTLVVSPNGPDALRLMAELVL